MIKLWGRDICRDFAHVQRLSSLKYIYLCIDFVMYAVILLLEASACQLAVYVGVGSDRSIGGSTDSITDNPHHTTKPSSLCDRSVYVQANPKPAEFVRDELMIP